MTTLKLLRELVKEPAVRPIFLRSPLLGLSAFASLHFLELLVGPKAAGLSVKDPAKLGAYRAKSSLLPGYSLFFEFCDAI